MDWGVQTMKGVVLAGGLGTRLRPLTRVTNKHLLPVYDKPMVFYPIQTLVEAGITEIMLVTGGNNAGEFLRLIGNGEEFGLKHMNYAYQKTSGAPQTGDSGIARFGKSQCDRIGTAIFHGRRSGACRTVCQGLRKSLSAPEGTYIVCARARARHRERPLQA